MNRRVLLRLYPRRWRARYGDEFLALLEQQPMTPLVVLDVVLGALDAHLRPHFAATDASVGGRALAALAALRTTALTVFCAYSAFVVAGGAFYGMVDDSAFLPMTAHPPLFAAWLTAEAGAAVSGAALVAGGLPIALATLAFALRHQRRDILVLLAVPFMAFAGIILLIVFLAAIFAGWIPAPAPIVNLAHSEGPQAGNVAILVMNVTVFTFAAVASTIALAVAVTRCEIGEQRFRAMGVRVVIQPYRFALLPARIVAVAMGVTLAGTLAWGIIAHAVLPHAFTTAIFVNWLAVIIGMTLSTLVAAVAVISGQQAAGSRQRIAE